MIKTQKKNIPPKPYSGDVGWMLKSVHMEILEV